MHPTVKMLQEANKGLLKLKSVTETIKFHNFDDLQKWKLMGYTMLLMSV